MIMPKGHAGGSKTRFYRANEDAAGLLGEIFGNRVLTVGKTIETIVLHWLQAESMDRCVFESLAWTQ